MRVQASLFSLNVRASLDPRCRTYGRANSYTPTPPFLPPSTLQPPVLVVGTLLLPSVAPGKLPLHPDVFAVASYSPTLATVTVVASSSKARNEREVLVAILLFQWQNSSPLKRFFLFALSHADEKT